MAASIFLRRGCKFRRTNFARYLSVNVNNEVKETHFGYQTVTEEEKAQKVQQVFTNVASRYDLMNDAMSAGFHRLWKDHFVATLNPTPGTRLIDVAGGTGDIAFRVLQFIRNASGNTIAPEVPSPDVNFEEILQSHVTVCDINPEMLKIGETKAKSMGYGSELAWVEGDAQDLQFDSDSFDAYTIAFGIRNVVDINKALRDAYRVLKPGGRFLCLEFSHVSNPVLGTLYDFYSFQVIPVLGQIIANDWNSYQYLVESIRKFPKPDEFERMIQKANFRNVYHEKLLCGVVAIHSGFKI